jgi:hypothetical protein
VTIPGEVIEEVVSGRVAIALERRNDQVVAFGRRLGVAVDPAGVAARPPIELEAVAPEPGAAAIEGRLHVGEEVEVVDIPEIEERGRPRLGADAEKGSLLPGGGFGQGGDLGDRFLGVTVARTAARAIWGDGLGMARAPACLGSSWRPSRDSTTVNR